jgi:hypothetical protein
MYHRLLLFLVAWGIFLPWPSSAESSPRYRSIEPPALRGGQSFLMLPVTWEVLRSGFNTLDAALEAETFSEVWGLHLASAYEAYLITPRGKARIVTSRLLSETPEGGWDTAILNEAEFARILGIDHSPWHPLDALVFMRLEQTENDSQMITLTASPQYFISVTIYFN